MSSDPGETVGAFLCQAGQMLRAAAIENPRMEARLLLGHAMGATGCLLLAVLAERPRAFGIGVDLVPEAAALARENARRNCLAHRAAFLAGDWAAALAGRFDLVLSNPPYIETAAIAGLMPEVARHEPRSALDGGADGLDAYRRLAADLPGLLAPGGAAVLELGAGQRAAVESLAVAGGLQPAECRLDLGGIERALVLRQPS